MKSAQDTLGLLWEFIGLVKPTFIAIAENHGITLQQLQVLSALGEAEPTPMSQLAAGLACDASNVTGLVDRLTTLGLATRTEFEKDRRIKMVSLTPKGVDLQRQLCQDFRAVYPTIFGALSEVEQQQLQNLLSKLVERKSH